jgi:hypothetical protein
MGMFSPTIMLNVIISCRMVLNLREMHTGMQAWSIGYVSQRIEMG